MNTAVNSITRILCLFLFATANFCLADTVELKSGKTLKGELTGRRAQFVSVTSKEAQSEIERRLNIDDIRSIQFSDAYSKKEAIAHFNSANTYQATSSLEPLVNKRIPYLDLLSESDERLFVMLLESYLNTGRGDDCLEQAKLWRTKLRSPKTRDDIEELQMIASWEMDRREEAAYYAQRWIDYGKSAQESTFAWNVLAEIALETDKPERALWTALNSIVFSRPNLPRHLSQSYEIAIVAAFRNDHPLYAKELLEEMRTRDIPWPIDSQRAKVIEQLDSITPNETERFHFHPTSNSTKERPAATLTKLVGSP